MTTQTQLERKEIKRRITEILLLQSDIAQFYSGAFGNNGELLVAWITERNTKINELIAMI